MLMSIYHGLSFHWHNDLFCIMYYKLFKLSRIWDCHTEIMNPLLIQGATSLLVPRLKNLGSSLCPVYTQTCNCGEHVMRKHRYGLILGMYLSFSNYKVYEFKQIISPPQALPSYQGFYRRIKRWYIKLLTQRMLVHLSLFYSTPHSHMTGPNIRR
jgi:hypothetical protein